MTKKGFTILEMVIIIIIIGIILAAGRGLFEVPTKYIIESEQCTNAINGQVMKFFYNAITGKLKSATNTAAFGFIDEGYSIVYNGTNTRQTAQSIRLSSLSGANREELYTASASNLILGNDANIPGCTSSTHKVLLSGGIMSGGILYPYRIDINKNLISTQGLAPMRICGADTGTTANMRCISGTQQFTGMIEFATCKTTSCMSFLKIFFDTRSQTIKSNKCLSIGFDRACQRRSTNDF